MNTFRNRRSEAPVWSPPRNAPPPGGSIATMVVLPDVTLPSPAAPVGPVAAEPVAAGFRAGPMSPLREAHGDAVSPRSLVEDAVSAAETKAGLPIQDLLIRGFLSGALLGIATSLAFTVRTQALPAIASAIIFPVGFVILVLLGLSWQRGTSPSCQWAWLPAGCRGLLSPGTGCGSMPATWQGACSMPCCSMPH